MNARTAASCATLLLTSFLSQCAMAPPYIPPYAGGGYSLDDAPSGRNRQDTRYLENTAPPPMPTADPNATQIGSAPAYDTPESIATNPPNQETPPASAPDTSTPPAPTTPPTTAATEPVTPPPPAPSTSSAPEQMPFGLPVPGKKGFVYSPFDKTQMVDVRGIPPGKKVRCPYTSKIFLVP